MGRMAPRAGKDSWGRRSDDPFIRNFTKDPKLAGRLSLMLTIGMILFWIMFISGMIFVAAYLIFF